MMFDFHLVRSPAEHDLAHLLVAAIFLNADLGSELTCQLHPAAQRIVVTRGWHSGYSLQHLGWK